MTSIMGGTTIRHNTRLLQIALCGALAAVAGGPAELEGQDQAFILELDFVAGSEPVTKTDDVTLEGLLEQAGLVPRIVGEGSDAEGKPDCLDEKDLHQMIPAMEDKEAAADTWYVHGLSAPKFCCNSGVTGSNLCGFLGAIWFQDPNGRLRQDFIVFLGEHSSKEDKLLTAMHEIAHVLNTHHCEYSFVGDSLMFSANTRAHLEDHRLRDPEYVRPGSDRPWCGELSVEHRRLHDTIGDACDTANDCPDTEILNRILDRPELRPKGVVLELETDSAPRYQPGEPFTVAVKLSADADSAAAPPLYLSGRSLDPRLGYLRFWIREGCKDEATTPFRPIYPMMFAEADLEPTAFDVDQPVARDGFPLWYSIPLPRRVPDSQPPQRRFGVRATYSGLVDPEADPFGRRRVALSGEMAISEERCVSVGGLSGFDSQAYELISDPEARLFLLMNGGDDLTVGRANLEKLALGQSVYSKYAKLALGANWATPFHRYDLATGQIVTREPDLEQARGFLEDLLALPEDNGLQLFYREMLKQICEGCRDCCSAQ